MARDIAVRGTVRAPLLVLDRRLDGEDTFLRGELRLDPDGTRIAVRIYTFDHVTVLQPQDGQAVIGDVWAGRLRLPAQRRRVVMPADLAAALAVAGMPDGLDALDERERRHLLGYLADATTAAGRHSRIVTIVSGLRGLTA